MYVIHKYYQQKIRHIMTISKETKSLDMPWEKEYGYAQAVKVGETIYLSGQVSHDEEGNIVGLRDMETQMRQRYANIQKVLAQYGATMDNIVDEVLFVTDMDSAFAARSSADERSFPPLLLCQAPLCKFSVLRFLSS